MKFSPTVAGWRTIWRDPAILLAEITWRWVFGLITTLVMVFSLLRYLSTIPIPAAAQWLMDTRRAALVGGTIAQMLRSSGGAATKLILVGLPALAALWIVLASVGRTATIQAMLPCDSEASPTQWRRMLAISFLRFAAWFATNVALCGALILAARATADLKDAVGTALLVFFSLALVTLSAWALLNWLLTLASIYVIRNGEETYTAITSAVDLLLRRFGPLLATSSLWAVVRSLAFLAATFLGFAAMALLRTVPFGYVLIGLLLITLGYLAFADLLYIGRLASYVTIVEADLEPPRPVPLSLPITPEPSFPQTPPDIIPPLLPELPAEN